MVAAAGHDAAAGHRSRALAGVAFIAAAVACFAALDTSTKFASASVPAAMVVWCRYLFQAVLTAMTLLPRHGRSLLSTQRPGMQVARGVLLLSCSVFGFYSLKAMPVAEYTAIVLMTPLLITLMAATSLGERVSPLRWACVGGGFLGAMVVIRPGAEMFNWAMLLPLALVITNTGYQVLTSRLTKVDDAGTVQFYSGCVGAGLATLALPFAWQPLPGSTWALLLLLGLLSTVGHYLLVLAFARAPVAVLTPYLYLQIGFAVLCGWLVFAQAPDLWSSVGIAVIALCGTGGTWLTARERL